MNSEKQDKTSSDSQSPNESAVGDSEIVLARSVDAAATSSSDLCRKNGLADYLSWAVIIAITLFIAISTAMEQFGEHEPRATTSADLMQVNLQSKILVGQRVVQGMLVEEQETNSEDDGEATNEAAEEKKPEPLTEPVALDSGTYEQRLCYAILLSELYGPQRAEEYFETLDKKVADANFEPDETQASLRGSVDRLIGDYAEGDFSQSSISEADKAELKERLGFSGELLLTPRGTDDQPGRKWVESVAQSKIVGAGVILIGGILFFLGGVIAACTILGLVFSNASPAKFTTEQSVGGIYLQTFAIWLFGFFGIQLILPIVFEAMKIQLDASVGIYLNFCIFFLSLSALAWPIVRGRRWSEVRKDIGWTGESFFKNVGIGIATYAAWLPMVLVGIFSVFILMILFPMSQDVGEFELPTSPSHPIQQLMSSGDSVVWLGVFLAACVAAPIVEETMFRGVFYRHLRQQSSHWDKALSVGVAAVINGVIFAAIHPQGVLAIPLLTTLAVGFALAREWRDSLVSSITMHALNNTMVTTMMLFLM